MADKLFEFRYVNTEGTEVTLGTKAPFFITKKTGLGAVTNDITTQNQYGLDGASLVSQQLAVREIKLTGEIFANSYAEMQHLRQQLISAFNPQLAGTLNYTVNDNTYMIDALVELAPDLDTEAQLMTQEFVIQLKALDPYWSDLTRDNQLIPLSGLEKVWGFPFTLSDSFYFSRIISGRIETIDNDGDVPTGAEFTMTLGADASNIKVLLVDSYPQVYFGFAGSYPAGSVLYVNTKHGQKQAQLTQPDGKVLNAMSMRMPDSTFFELKKGTNNLQILADTGQESIVTDMRFNPLVMGV